MDATHRTSPSTRANSFNHTGQQRIHTLTPYTMHLWTDRNSQEVSIFSLSHMQTSCGYSLHYLESDQHGWSIIYTPFCNDWLTFTAISLSLRLVIEACTICLVLHALQFPPWQLNILSGEQQCRRIHVAVTSLHMRSQRGLDTLCLFHSLYIIIYHLLLCLLST